MVKKTTRPAKARSQIKPIKRRKLPHFAVGRFTWQNSRLKLIMIGHSPEGPNPALLTSSLNKAYRWSSRSAAGQYLSHNLHIARIRGNGWRAIDIHRLAKPD